MIQLAGHDTTKSPHRSADELSPEACLSYPATSNSQAKDQLLGLSGFPGQTFTSFRGPLLRLPDCNGERMMLSKRPVPITPLPITIVLSVLSIWETVRPEEWGRSTSTPIAATSCIPTVSRLSIQVHLTQIYQSSLCCPIESGPRGVVSASTYHALLTVGPCHPAPPLTRSDSSLSPLGITLRTVAS